MNIENLDNVQIVKLVVHGEGLTQKSMCEKLGKEPTSFSQVIHRNTLRISDLQAICKLLGYELVLKKKEK